MLIMLAIAGGIVLGWLGICLLAAWINSPSYAPGISAEALARADRHRKAAEARERRMAERTERALWWLYRRLPRGLRKS